MTIEHDEWILKVEHSFSSIIGTVLIAIRYQALRPQIRDLPLIYELADIAHNLPQKLLIECRCKDDKALEITIAQLTDSINSLKATTSERSQIKQELIGLFPPPFRGEEGKL